jgi:hypothetical protein
MLHSCVLQIDSSEYTLICRVRLNLCLGGVPSRELLAPSRTQAACIIRNLPRNEKFVSFMLSDTLNIGRCMCIACAPSFSRLRAVMFIVEGRGSSHTNF